MEKKVLGHIDCPTCGTAHGMRISEDKNGDPFGYCEVNCGQQLRIGGDPRRIRDFRARYAWAAKPVPAPAPVTATTTTAPTPLLQEKKPVTVTENPTPDQFHGPVRKRSAFEDMVSSFGAKRK